INSNQLPPFPHVLPERVIGDSIKPGRKLRFPTKASDVFVSAYERFLGKIVGQLDVGAHELAQQAAHGRLMTANQLAKSVLVPIRLLRKQPPESRPTLAESAGPFRPAYARFCASNGFWPSC